MVSPAATNQELKVSIIVPVFNAPQSIRHCILSLKNQSYVPHEIIVVDDASTDHTRDVVREYGVTLIEKNINEGAGSTRAAGAEAAGGDIFAFIDSDCEAPFGWVEGIIKGFEEKPDLGVIGGGYLHNNDISTIYELYSFLEEEYHALIFSSIATSIIHHTLHVAHIS